jgi:hypothetical protein
MIDNHPEGHRLAFPEVYFQMSNQGWTRKQTITIENTIPIAIAGDSILRILHITITIRT